MFFNRQQPGNQRIPDQLCAASDTEETARFSSRPFLLRSIGAQPNCPSMPLLASDPEYNRKLSARAVGDLALVRAALAGSSKAYEQLRHNYRRSVYHLVLRIVRNADEAEDITAEAFANAFRLLPRYQDEHVFSTWLFRIATNRCIDFLRSKKLPALSHS